MSERVRLAIVCRACGEGGSVANVALRQARELAAHLDVILVSDSFPEEAAGRRLAVEARRFSHLRRFAHVPAEIAFCLAAARGLRSLAERGDLDLVLFHSHAAAAIAIPRLRRYPGLRFAMLTHGDIFERPRGTYDWRLTAFYRLVTPRAYRACDRVIALSPDMAEWARRGGAPPERVTILPNGIEPADLGAPVEPTPGGPPPLPPLRVLFVGRLAREKGVEFLLRGVALAIRRGVGLRVAIAGDGPLRRSLRGLVDELALEQVVEVTGPVPRAGLAAHYRRAHVVFVPSLSDPLPTVVLEALALGVPVVGAAVGGIPFLVEDGSNGLLVPPGDEDAIAASLERLAGDPALLAALARRAQESVYPKYSWARVAERLNATLLGMRLDAGARAERAIP